MDVPIHYTQGTFKKIRCAEPWNAMLISDLHFAADRSSYFSPGSVEKTLRILPDLIMEEKVQQLFILGDIFHSQWLKASSNEEEFQRGLISRLYDLDIYVIMIGGNHDSHLFRAYSKIWTKNKLYAFTDQFLELTTEKGDKVWLAHDGGNSYWLTTVQVKPFLINLKKAYELPPENWLITGHTHHPRMLEEHKAASIGCFNTEGHNGPLSYGLLKDEGGIFKIELKFGTDTLKQL